MLAVVELLGALVLLLPPQPIKAIAASGVADTIASNITSKIEEIFGAA